MNRNALPLMEASDDVLRNGVAFCRDTTSRSHLWSITASSWAHWRYRCSSPGHLQDLRTLDGKPSHSAANLSTDGSSSGFAGDLFIKECAATLHGGSSPRHHPEQRIVARHHAGRGPLEIELSRAGNCTRHPPVWRTTSTHSDDPL